MPGARRAPRLIAAGVAALALALALPATVPAAPPSVPGVLARLLASGGLSEEAYRRDAAAYGAAVRSSARLQGTRALELGAVIANVRAMAAAGTLTASRAPAVFLTLERNRSWWTNEPLPASGQRVRFPGSRLVWQYYPGQGLEIQWLATFGAANGYYLAGHENANLRQLLDEALPLASQRAGGIAWDYLFQFDGGRPPWTSGLSQGTAVQVLARAYQRLHEPAYLTAAQQALGVFEHHPPLGVRVDTPAGATYAEYTYAPSDRILNGFVQALVGLYDYTAITHDPVGLGLFEAGNAEARVEVPHYDTGAWSRYDQHEESDLNYHELLEEFLQHLCERTRRGLPGAPQPASAIAGDEEYCTAARHFREDLTTPPVIALLTQHLAAGVRAGVQMSLSKVSTVTLTVRRGGRVVWTNTATVEAGRPRLLWPTPSGGGTFQISLAARDLAGNFSTTSGAIVVSRRPTRA